MNLLHIPQTRISEVKNYIKGKEYNQELAVFINFKIPSGKYRYFIYNLKKNIVVQEAVVSHGSGSVIPKSDALKFSNIEGSYQSSLGKYVIGESYVGKFGKAYRLTGLDSTNSNAVQRAIVLHSYGCIPDVESNNRTCLSLGCPMLSINAFRETAKYIDQSKKPIILYAFY
ncbi:murein L,D-transpeptidase catalytic domain-containing protein [Chryseobacterium sp. CBSDS_008]|uniref:murein L,D-transpeptidase catalytic domain-containing protein n=1 Tax=Chryseobacterium sp. CBSDS_008 TaxID=3415265 RepID=UPI003CF2697E